MLLLAVSGGRDSVALLEVFAKKKFKEFGLKINLDEEIKIIFFNHGTSHSQEAENFAQNLAKKYELELLIGRTKKKLKSEAEFREARLDFFIKIAREQKANFVVTAHHANDSAETILLNLVRGSGPSGLTGIKEFSRIKNSSIRIWRPFVGKKRSEIDGFIKKRKLDFLDDPSNLDKKFSRNLIRHEVIPRLEKINPKAIKNIISSGQKCNDCCEIIGQQAAEWLTENASSDFVPLKKINQLSDFFAREIFREIHKQETGNCLRLESKHFEEILELTKNPAGNKKKRFGAIEFSTNKKHGVRVLMWQ